MANVDYWDTSTDTSVWFTTNDTAASTTDFCDYRVVSREGRVYTREILVESPEHWKDEDHKAYVDLVNNKTRTGWIVKFIIKGKVMITDPTIETRKMKDFIPLLKWRASGEDRQKIDEFFKEHKLEP
ncbi:MAG: hypothetical protein KKD77_20450 [Gammaproteobacteria bacterium]|nr:hypothetical protein [Gammaproteobacteria bacterium]